MKRTDPWRRWVNREHAAVWNPGGRFGLRRVRVNECWFVLKAEDLYTEALAHDASKFAPGSRGTAVYSIAGLRMSADWEIRQNAVWRLGRVFLGCSRCSSSWLACRRCWGLTYSSRTLQNYRQIEERRLRQDFSTAVVAFLALEYAVAQHPPPGVRSVPRRLTYIVFGESSTTEELCEARTPMLCGGCRCDLAVGRDRRAMRVSKPASRG